MYTSKSLVAYAYCMGTGQELVMPQTHCTGQGTWQGTIGFYIMLLQGEGTIAFYCAGPCPLKCVWAWVTKTLLWICGTNTRCLKFGLEPPPPHPTPSQFKVDPSFWSDIQIIVWWKVFWKHLMDTKKVRLKSIHLNPWCSTRRWILVIYQFDAKKSFHSLILS